ncbi:RdgB/HAM1 family non-canonical purine NTP pyrophosphatase [Mucilaginibacter sp. HMF7410]|uniref:dITP/XTP pyrophosphatase n=2 Tax=Mucilaginibacter arboris TaxID=2682090 RepID=A0A7K1SWN4_9SPHI|nr:RdgB/HAM1 family non-canonical purine NTP pyrophosphatase [Mucilaginibacter arboris]
MMKELVFATNNAHKIEEVADAAGNQFKILRLKDIHCNDEIEETGTTFRENASIKTHYIFNKYGLDCFGDDSGLEIEALYGEPGVFSARYAGEHGNHAANIARVLDQMEGVTNRKAQFKTVISLLWKGQEYWFEGIVHGTIHTEVSGNLGFGYDPIFQPEGYPVTFAEMSLQEKNNISHRGKAMAKLIDFLKKL